MACWRPCSGLPTDHNDPTGAFTRQLFLGEALGTEHIEASYHDGVLTLRLPVAEHAKPHKVAIGTGKKAPAAVAA